MKILMILLCRSDTLIHIYPQFLCCTTLSQNFFCHFLQKHNAFKFSGLVFACSTHFITAIFKINYRINHIKTQSQSQCYFMTGGLLHISLGVKPLETQNQRLFFSTEPLWWESLCNILSDKMGLSLMNMPGLSSSVRIASKACYWKTLPFALYTIPLSVQDLQSRSFLSHVSYAIMAA
jgi:hypothetical protein